MPTKSTTIALLALIFWLLLSKAALAEIRGWQLHDPDLRHILSVLDKAKEYDINHVQLSHGIGMSVNEVLETPGRIALVNLVTQRAHSQGAKVFQWAHEFESAGGRPILPVISVDLDGPMKSFWQSRLDSYREFFEKCPEVDGIVLMFGSASMEPWHMIPHPSCQMTRDMSMPERLATIINHIAHVVRDELGKEVIVRDFNHAPQQQEWICETAKLVEGVTWMPKCVPQDWEPYYPHNPMIGNTPGSECIVEFDLGMEYMGQSAFPVALPEYLKYRLGYQKRAGTSGYVARVERGSRWVFENPNELNVYALQKFWENPDLTIDDFYRDYLPKTYSVDPSTEMDKLEKLEKMFSNTFHAARKMYYILGFWCLEKGSDVTTRGTYPALLDGRSLALWNPDYQPWYERLKAPDGKTMRDIFQEKMEAEHLAQESLDLLNELRSEFTDAQFTDLKDRLEILVKCTNVWKWLADSIFRYQHLKTQAEGSEQYARQRALLEGSLQELESISTEIRGTRRDMFPGNPDRIEQCVQSIRDALGGGTRESEEFRLPQIAVAYSQTNPDEGTPPRLIASGTKPPEVVFDGGEWGVEPMRMSNSMDSALFATRPPRTAFGGLIDINQTVPNRRYVFRFKFRHPTHGDWETGDFWFWTPPIEEYPEGYVLPSEDDLPARGADGADSEEDF
ncbi:MAG: hypothetical protein NUW37_01050 [Planctomycetes bacterium]|nr:hypothetical protein [Planctomycetota bacterium]